MKITRFQVMDPLDWGVRAQPYLLAAVNERLTDGKEKSYAESRVVQYGPFFELHNTESMPVGRFNALDGEYHSPRLITIQLSVNDMMVQPWYMDLKRARYELKKFQREQEWSIRLDQYHAERSGEMLYIPVKLSGNACGGWLGDREGEGRCKESADLTLTHAKDNLPVFLCPKHRAADARDHFDRRRISA